MHSRVTRHLFWALGICGLVLTQVDSAFATFTPPAPVPEVSGATLSTGIAAVTGGLLILRAWRRR